MHHQLLDIEFTVEAGRLWMLETRAAKRSTQAAVRIAVGLIDDGVIDTAAAVSMVTPARPGALDGQLPLAESPGAEQNAITLLREWAKR